MHNPEFNLYIRYGPLPLAMTTRIIAFSLEDRQKPSFTTGILGGRSNIYCNSYNLLEDTIDLAER